ncbi:MAG: GNAT family N-acetyltransferase [Sulfobacillus sp.]
MVHLVMQDRNNGLYTVRSANGNDAAAIVEILAEVGSEGIYIANEGAYMTVEHQAIILSSLDPHTHLVLVAEQDGRLVGTLEMVRGTFRKNAHTANFGMALRAPARGRRIGEGLLRAAHQWAQSEGVEKICLSVFSSNRGAIALYQRMGYQEEGRRRNQFRLGETLVDEVLMAWYLPPRLAH